MTGSRASQIRTAVRGAMKARLMVSGPAGSGKTFSSLIVATELAEGQPFAFVDTEEESALTYADLFSFKHLPWSPPYDARELAATLNDLGREFPVVVVDSLSHYWRGEGGILNVADGKFGGWKIARPAHEDMVHAILRNPAHMVICVRSKMAYEQGKNEQTGKLEVTKLGMAPQQDADLEYEMNVSVEVNIEHQIAVAKSRCADLATRTFQPGHAADLAVIYAKWLKGGEPVAERSTVDALVERMNALDVEQRTACKRAFLDRIGRPEYLRISQVDEAEALVASFEIPGPADAATFADREDQEDQGQAVGSPTAVDPGPPPVDREEKAGVLSALSRLVTGVNKLPPPSKRLFHDEAHKLALPSLGVPRQWTSEHADIAAGLLAEIEGSAGPIITPSRQERTDGDGTA